MTVQGLGDLRLPDPGKDRQQKGLADGLQGLSRNGSPCERRTVVDAGYNGIRELAPTYE